jgi:murein DD-endopeptidase MepM/ murein hydrolase activator NlpD
MINNSSMRKMAVLAFMATAIVFSVSLAVAEEDIFNYQDGYTATQLFQWPMDSSDRVDVCYGYYKNCNGIINGHAGIDISPKSDNPNPLVRATAFGEICNIIINDVGCASNCEGPGKGCNDHGFGNTIIIKHELENGDIVYSLYAHLDSIGDNIQIGGYVNAGEPIGVMGASGYGQKKYWVKPCKPNNNPHLHFEIKDGNTLLNPSGTCTSCYGYVNGHPDDYGYHNPENYFGNNEYKVHCSIKLSWEFNTPGNNENWVYHNIDAWSVGADGRLRIDPGSADPWIEQSYISIDSNTYNTISINMASNAPDGSGAIYFTTSELPGFSEDRKVEFDVNNDGQWHDYNIFMGAQPLWAGTITGIRLDPANNGKEGEEVDSIGFDYIMIEQAHIILDQSIYPNTASAGDELTFVFNIDNNFSNEIEDVRLGARIRTHDPQGEWIDDMPDDKIITLKPGANTYSRVFRTTDGLSNDFYDVEWVVMDEGTKRLIDYEDMCPILTISSESTKSPEPPAEQPASVPKVTQKDAGSPIWTGNAEVDEAIGIISPAVREMIDLIMDLLDELM